MKTEISHEIFGLYLSKLGWRKVPSNRSSIDIFVEPNTKDPLEIFIPNQKISGYSQKIVDAIKVLSFASGEEEQAISRRVYGYDKDLHNYRIMKSQPDGAPIGLVHTLVGANKFLLLDASRYFCRNKYQNLSRKEQSQTKSPSEESALFVDHCKFLHTWEGSFGITIAAPLWLMSTGLLDDMPDTLGRQTTKLIISGFALVANAVRHKSSDYILDHINNPNEFLIFKEFPELLGTINNDSIEYSASTSPMIKMQGIHQTHDKYLINEESVTYIHKAIDQLTESQSTLKIRFNGFPKTITTSKEGVLIPDANEGERKVSVMGTSSDIGHATLTMVLSIEDYQKASQAQGEGRDVTVTCEVQKRVRGWDVVKVLKFDILE